MRIKRGRVTSARENSSSRCWPPDSSLARVLCVLLEPDERQQLARTPSGDPTRALALMQQRHEHVLQHP